MSELRSRTGEVVRDAPPGRAVILAGTDELAVVEFQYGPGESGPPLHIHHEHVDSFYVLEGELTFVIGPDREVTRAGPGTFVSVPTEVVHTFRNDGPAEARFLNFHTPSAGFHRYMLGEKQDFDQHEPPADGGRPASEVTMLSFA